MMPRISKTSRLAQILVPLTAVLVPLSVTSSSCDIEKSLKETKQRIEELQREAFKRDRKNLEIAKIKINQLGELRNWTQNQRRRAMTNILSKASAMTMGERASALSKRSDALNSAKHKDQQSCQKLAALQETFLQLSELNKSTWQILLNFIDRQIARETSQTQ